MTSISVIMPISVIMQEIAELSKRALEQRVQLWRLQLDVLLRQMLLRHERAVSREAVMSLFQPGFVWRDSRAPALCGDLLRGNEIPFDCHTVQQLCVEIGIPLCGDKAFLCVQTKALAKHLKSDLGWQPVRKQRHEKTKQVGN